MPRPRNPGLPADANAADNPTPRGYIKLRDIGPVRVFVDRQSGALATNYRGDLHFYGDMDAIEAYARAQDGSGWRFAFLVSHRGADLADHVLVEVKPIDPLAQTWIDRQTGKTYPFRTLVPATRENRERVAAFQARIDALHKEREAIRKEWSAFVYDAVLMTGHGGRVEFPEGDQPDEEERADALGL